MAQIVNGVEPSFYVQRLISKAGGWDHYHETLQSASAVLKSSLSDDPLDMWKPDDDLPLPRKRKRRRKDDSDMRPDEMRNARGKLGKMWGMDRPLTLTEMGRVLRLGGVRPDQSVRDYERGKTAISGPLSLLIELLLAGAKPPNLKSILIAAQSGSPD